MGEGKTLSEMLGAAAEIEVTEMTPQVMNSSSLGDKYLIELSKGRSEIFAYARIAAAAGEIKVAELSAPVMNMASPDDKFYIKLPNGPGVALISAADLQHIKRLEEFLIGKFGKEEADKHIGVILETTFNSLNFSGNANQRINQFPTTFGVGRSVLDIQDTDDDGQLGNSRDKRNEEDAANNDKRLQGVYSIIAEMFHFCRVTLLSPFKANRETTNNPASSNDFNAPQGAVRKTFKVFLRSSLDIPLHQRVIMIMLFGGILKQLVENFLINGPFEITTNTSAVNINETIFAFIPKFVHMAAIMMCYMAIWVLVLPLESGVLMFLVPLLIFAPLFLVINLFSKASATGVDVVLFGGLFNFPIIGFVALGAFGFCLVSVSVIFLVFYFIWRYTGQRTPASGQESDQVLNNLMEVMSNV